MLIDLCTRKIARCVLLLIPMIMILVACGSDSATRDPNPNQQIKVGVILDVGGETDKSFNEYTLKGAREAAERAGITIDYITSTSPNDYERNIANMARESDLVITVGFFLADATARVARNHPDVHFAIVDNAYSPGQGCPETVNDCYNEEGGLHNVTSLMFAEDEVGYLAGVLAACMSETGVVASVAGMEIAPVVRFVNGFQNGAVSVNPDIRTLNQYIPDFNDPSTGEVVAKEFINQGADVIFGVGGNTGNGGLLAAHQANLMAIGVDADQYYTYPEVQSALLSSAMKNLDVASSWAVDQFVAGTLEPGIHLATLADDGIALAPYHDWHDRIVAAGCDEQVAEARDAIIKDPTITGAK